jgi:hypothetical protein
MTLAEIAMGQNDQEELESEGLDEVPEEPDEPDEQKENSDFAQDDLPEPQIADDTEVEG